MRSRSVRMAFGLSVRTVPILIIETKKPRPRGKESRHGIEGRGAPHRRHSPRVSTGNEGVVGIRDPGRCPGDARGLDLGHGSSPHTEARGQILPLPIRELTELRTFSATPGNCPMTAIRPIFFMRARPARDRDAWIL